MSSEFEPKVAVGALQQMILPGTTALVLVDIQEDFVSPDGAAARWGDVAAFEPALERIEALITAAGTRGVARVYLRVVTRPQTDSAALKTLHERKGRPPESLALCRAGTSGADYYRVVPQPGDIEIEKALYSGFAGTDLEARLRARGIDTLVLVGFTTDCCVDCTARDAFHRDFNVFVVTDACGAYEPALHEGALNGLAKNCALLTVSADVLAAWA